MAAMYAPYDDYQKRDALCAQWSPILVATDNKVIDLTNPKSEDEGSEWWMRLTELAGEGMVVKPLNFIERAP